MCELKNGYALYAHQQQVLSWMDGKEKEEVYGIKGGMLCLSMGLGKTLISLYHSFTHKGVFPTLIVTSKTVMHEWKSEGVEKFFNSGSVLYLHRDFLGKAIDKVSRKKILQYDVVITTYDVCIFSCKRGKYFEHCLEYGTEGFLRDKVVSIHVKKRKHSNFKNFKGTDVIYGTPWERVICDESQKYANPKSLTYKCIMAIYGKYKWCLSGTPIRNYDTDIWAQLRFCGYNGVDKICDWKKAGKFMFVFHNLICNIYVMSYTATDLKLPNKIEHEIKVELGDCKQFYEEILSETCTAFRQMLRNKLSYSCILALFTRLRQCAVAPYLVSPDAKTNLKDSYELNNYGIKSPKIQKIVEVIESIDCSQKIIIFSMFTSCLNLLRKAVQTTCPSFQFVQVDGRTKNKEELLTKFKTSNTIRALFMTYKVGSEGLNLTEATHCIFIEPWWTNSVHSQAKSRLWRTGQTKEVHVYTVIVSDTIEEKIVEICKSKDNIVESYLEGKDRVSADTKIKLDKKTLGQMLGL